MTTDDSKATQPRTIGWITGLLLLFVSIQLGVVLPAVLLYLLIPNAVHWASGAMIGGLLVTWLALIGVLRLGQRRGWWT